VPVSPLATFIDRLFSEGKTVVEPGPEPVSPCPKSAVLLREAWQQELWHFPGQAPDFDPSAALPAAAWLYHAAMCYADRSMTGETCAELLRPPLIPRRDAVAHFCVDLTLRHLPALHGLAVGLSQDDPLLESLRRMAWQWPLSGAGVPGDESWGPPEVQGIASHPGLWRFYLDRITALGDATSMRDEATRLHSRQRLGLHPELAFRLLPHWRKIQPDSLVLPSQSSPS